MQGLELVKNSKFKLREFKSIKLKDDECEIKVKSVGICSSDIERGFNRGAYHYPLVMGHEISGIVTKTGVKIKKIRVGDRVTVFPLLPCFKCSQCGQKNYVSCLNYQYYGSRNNGGYIEYMNIKEWNLIKINKVYKF